jgi:hypothetical protein
VLSELHTVSITIGILTACISVVIGVVNSILSNRREEKRRQTQIFLQLYNRFQEKDLRETELSLIHGEWKDYDDWLAQHHPRTHQDARASYQSMMSYYLGVSVLVEQGLIDIELVEPLLGRRLFRVWQASDFITQEVRKRTRIPWKQPLYQPFERIANQMEQRLLKPATTSS